MPRPSRPSPLLLRSVRRPASLALLLALSAATGCDSGGGADRAAAVDQGPGTPEELVALFQEWRDFERTDWRNTPRRRCRPREAPSPGGRPG